MAQTRRGVLKHIAVGVVGLGGTALVSDTAAAKPAVDWESADASNYSGANRGANDISWVVIHTVQGSASGAVSWFQNPNSNVSAHYTIAQGGHRYQSVADQNIAWHAGGQNYNTWSIGIEHGGYVSGTYEETQYQNSATITSWLCDQYNIPKVHPSGVAPCDASTDGGIIGHHQVPEADCGPNNHTDPGSNWDWDHYMDLVGGTNNGGGDGSISMGDRVTPTTALNTRYRPGTESRILATMSPGTEGEIMNGPVSEDGYTWWGVHWLADDIWGWSVERYLNTT